MMTTLSVALQFANTRNSYVAYLAVIVECRISCIVLPRSVRQAINGCPWIEIKDNGPTLLWSALLTEDYWDSTVVAS